MKKVFNTGQFDDWGNPIWKEASTNETFLDVDWNNQKPNLHTITSEWEADCPIKNFVIVPKPNIGCELAYRPLGKCNSTDGSIVWGLYEIDFTKYKHLGANKLIATSDELQDWEHEYYKRKFFGKIGIFHIPSTYHQLPGQILGI
jgi:hypothetical protein